MYLKMEKAISILLTSMLLLSLLFLATPKAFAQATTVRFIPGLVEVHDAAEEFCVAAVVEDVTDLAGLDIQISWNTTYLTYVNHTLTATVEDFPSPIPPSPYAGIIHNPPLPLKAGMVVLDIAVPTGFEPVRESIEDAVAGEPLMKRFEVAGRKVILYIEDMDPGDSISFSFEARALYPVKAKGVASEAYSYYKPEWRGETLGGEIAVSEEGR